MSWMTALAFVKRWFKPIVGGLLVAVIAWLSMSSGRLAGERDTLQVQLDQARLETKTALEREAQAREARRAADTSAEAALVRAELLEMAVSRQKGTIDALEKKYGATAVSQLTRDHLGRLRDAQQRSD
ncbi:MAG: hypothetical protein GW854_01570 [Erythrobacter sp.]|nr:hypothetical protein [Erythrobacter sp.]